MHIIRIRWEVPHYSEVHRITIGGRTGSVIVIRRGCLPSGMVNVNRRVARGRVHSIAFDERLCAWSNSVKDTLLGKIICGGWGGHFLGVGLSCWVFRSHDILIRDD